MNKILILVVFMLVLAGCLVFFSRTQQKKSQSQLLVSVDAPTPTPTSFPFEQLTIPYLQKRAYESTLTELTDFSSSSTYTSHLTTYKSDGLTIRGLITKPKGEMPKQGWPAIVFVHGYIPPTLYKTTERYNDYIDALSRNGFVVFKIDLRGHGESEGTPGGAYFSSDYVVDTLNAYSALQHSSFVNPQSIGLWGHSMAGNVVLRSFVVKPEIPAVVIWAGAVYSYTDQQTYGINDQSYRPPISNAPLQNRRRELMELYGQPSQESSFWKQVAPTNYLSTLRGAIQVDHAVDDTVVNIGYSRDLMKLLDQTDVIHELHEFSSGGHNISGVSFNQAMGKTIDFYKKYLTE